MQQCFWQAPKIYGLWKARKQLSCNVWFLPHVNGVKLPWCGHHEGCRITCTLLITRCNKKTLNKNKPGVFCHKVVSRCKCSKPGLLPFTWCCLEFYRHLHLHFPLLSLSNKKYPGSPQNKLFLVGFLVTIVCVSKGPSQLKLIGQADLA